MSQELSSQLLSKAVNEMAKLPGIGRKTALRLVLHLLRNSDDGIDTLAASLLQLKKEIKHCKVCHNISDTDICPICSDVRRDASTICVVENIQDVMAIENTLRYNGLYHVLGGLISPMDGIGPSELEIQSLCQRVDEGDIKEIIFALSSTMEGDTTAFYVFRQLEKLEKATSLHFSAIARGISVGDELEYADELTLGRSIANRIKYDGRQ